MNDFIRLFFFLPVFLIISCDKPPLTDNGVVGSFGHTGLGDGDFSYPRTITITPQNKIFVADKSGRIQRFNEKGQFETGWWMPEWQAGKPLGLAVHSDGRLFIADTHYHRVQIYSQDGKPLAVFGKEGNGPGEFQLPTDVEIDRDGNIYVSEYGGNDRISKFSPDLKFIQAIGDQPIAGLRLSRPAKMAIDQDNILWVADACNHRIVKFSLDGKYLGGFGQVGEQPGQLRWPYDINLCRDGTLMISEYGNHRLQWFDTSGHSLRIWGRAGRNLGELYAPWAAMQAANGLIYVVDSLNNRVQIVKIN